MKTYIKSHLAFVLIFISIIAKATSNNSDSLFVDVEQHEYDSIVAALYAPVYECHASSKQTSPPRSVKMPLKATASNTSIPTVTINKSKAVGEIAIYSSVSPTGAKTYSVPIQVLNGMNGFQPNVSLEYNSQSGNSVVGVGWSIGGLSSIVRGNKNLYYDGKILPIALNEQDAFYLSGIRLIQLSKTTDYIEYETEQGNIKVRGYYKGSILKYFEVFYPNGSKGIFGYKENTTYNRIEYPLTTLNDILGNKILFEYQYIDNRYNITKITYNNCSIEFSYNNTRADKQDMYCSGTKVVTSQLLSAISVKNGDKILRTYSLQYSVLLNKTVLTQIDLSAEGKSVNPLQFKYGDGDSSNSFDTDVTQLTEWYNSSDPNMIKVVRGRFGYNYNEEGLIVLPNKNPYMRETRSAKWNRHSRNRVNNLYSGDEKIFLYAGLQKDIADPMPNLTTGKGFIDILCADIDGVQEERTIKINNYVENGKDKLVFSVYSQSLSSSIALQYTRAFTFSTAHKDNDGGWSVQPKHYFIGDFNGDGKQEIMAISFDHVFSENEGESKCYIFDLPNNKIIYQSSAIKYKVDLVGSGQSDPQDAANKSDKIFTADIDGDGKTDLCHINQDGTHIYRFDSNNFSLIKVALTSSLNTNFLKNKSILLGDFNGDGLVDIMTSPTNKNRNEKQWAKFISQGNGYFSHTTYNSFINDATSGCGFFAQDVNNDGITDAVSFGPNSFTIHITKDVVFPEWGPIVSYEKPQSILVPFNINSHYKNNKLICIKDGKATKYSFKTNVAKDLLLTQVINSLGVIEQNKYTPLVNNNGVYTRGSGAKYPYINITEPIYVVYEESSFANGVKIDNNKYKYSNAVVHRQGLGFRGFEKFIKIDNRGRYSTATYAPYNYCVPISIVTPTTETQYTYSHNVQSNKILKTRLTKVTEKDRLTEISCTTTYSYDTYGFPTTTTATYSDGVVVKTETSYSNNSKVGDGYSLGVSNQQKKTITRNGTSITEQIVYPVINKRQPNVVLNITDGKQWRQKSFHYDAYGNVIKEEERSFSGNTFTKEYEYDAQGRVTKITDPLGLVSLYTYDLQGNVLSSTDCYGNKTTYTYDAWGREITMKAPDGVSRNTTYEWSDNIGLYEVNITQNNAPEYSAFYDALHRIVRKSQKRITGSFCKTDYVYDSYGNLSKVSLPFQHSKSAVEWNTYDYDSYNRILSEKQSNGKITTYKYNKNIVTTEKDGIATSRTYDSQGNITKVSDPSGSIVYNLAPDGQPNIIVVNGNTSINYTYDICRRTISIDDPSRGITQYVYTGANISEKIHANGETIYYTYDKYDRCSQMRTDDGFSATYTYNKYGDIAKVTGNNGTSSTYSYDIFGRLTEQKDIAPDNKWLQRTYIYNDGHVRSIKYTSQNGDLATEEYSYTNGHLSTIKVGNDVIYALRAEDNMAFPSTVQIGNSYQTYSHTSNGLIARMQTAQSGKTLQNISFQYNASTDNLISRTDNINKKEERFVYDNINRLTSFGSNNIEYSNNGNILSKTDAGSYSYNNATNKYAVTKISPTENSIPMRNQSVSYTSFSRPATIEENGTKATFTYNANFERVKMVLSQNNATTKHYYLGNCYEVEQSATATIERLYLAGNFYTSHVVLCREKSNTKKLYLLRDNLGSINKIIDAGGNTLQELSYDAWGRLRNPQTLKPYAPGEEPQLIIGRGYTGHEHLTAFGLINMNARLYDPSVGRFLSPDPYVQDITNLQNYNAYSYCLNNPLKYTDPTGESWKKFWKGLLGTLFIPILCPSTMLTLAIDFTRTTLFKGGFDITSSSSMHSAWRNFDPTKEGSYTNNAYKIDMGLYKTDSDLNSGKRFWQFVSRTSWECLQTYTGLFYSHGKNIAGCVNRVDYYGGATYCTNENSSSVKTDRGVTMGNYINIDINDEINKPFYTYMTTAHNGIYMHEYGHTLQGRNYGVAYLFCIGVPSLRSAASHDDHKNQWYEREASAYARRYFGEEVWTEKIKESHPSYGFLGY